LDEPTTSLDEERRKAFVRVIWKVLRKCPWLLFKMTIITYGADVSENSDADAVLRLSIAANGS
jgi:hypothetical protein